VREAAPAEERTGSPSTRSMAPATVRGGGEWKGCLGLEKVVLANEVPPSKLGRARSFQVSFFKVFSLARRISPSQCGGEYITLSILWIVRREKEKVF
jgi:hypothetical protein